MLIESEIAKCCGTVCISNFPEPPDELRKHHPNIWTKFDQKKIDTKKQFNNILLTGKQKKYFNTFLKNHRFKMTRK